MNMNKKIFIYLFLLLGLVNVNAELPGEATNKVSSTFDVIYEKCNDLTFVTEGHITLQCSKDINIEKNKTESPQGKSCYASGGVVELKSIACGPKTGKFNTPETDLTKYSSGYCKYDGKDYRIKHTYECIPAKVEKSGTADSGSVQSNTLNFKVAGWGWFKSLEPKDLNKQIDSFAEGACKAEKGRPRVTLQINGKDTVYSSYGKFEEAAKKLEEGTVKVNVKCSLGAGDFTGPGLSEIITEKSPRGENIGENFCDQEEVIGILKIVGYVVLILKVTVPLIIIITATIDYFKEGVLEQNLKTPTMDMLKRIALAITIFFVPTVINAFLTLSNVDNLDGTYKKCFVCLVNTSKCK